MKEKEEKVANLKLFCEKQQLIRITIATVRCPDRFKNIADFLFHILGHDETDVPQFQSALGKKDLQEKVV